MPPWRALSAGRGGVHLSGGLNPTGAVADSLILSAVNTYGGATTIDGSATFPGGSNNVGTLTLSGSANNSSALSVGLGGTLNITGSSNNTRFSDTAPVTFAGGRITVAGLTAGSAFNETFGTFTASGENTFAFTAPTSGANVTSTLAFGAPTLNDRATLFFAGAFLGATTTTGTGQATFAGGLTNVSDPLAATPGLGQATGVVPYAAGNATSATSTTPTAFVYYNASSGVQLLPVTNAAYVNQSSGTGITAAMAHLNVNLLGTANSSSGNALGINTSQTINALSTSSTQYLAGNGIITVNSGAVVTGAGLTLAGPTLDFGSATGYIHLGGTLTLASGSAQSQITGSGGVVISGVLAAGTANRGVLFSNATAGNPFTGGLTLNSVTATFDNDAELGTSGGAITLDGGSLQLSSTVSALTLTRPIRLGAAGGSASAFSGQALTLAGNITGPGALTTTSSAATTLLALTGANSYAGGTFIQSAVLNVMSGSNLGTGPVSLLGNATLQFAAATTLSQNVNILSSIGETIDTNGFNATLAGQVTGAFNGVALTKVGVGTLNLTANDATLGSQLNVSAGALALSGNGAIPQALQVIMAAGAEFRVDNTGTNLPDRVADQANFILPATSTLHLIGGDAPASGETVGDLNLSTGAVNFVVDGTGATLTAGTAVSGPGSINKTGTGTLVLAAGRGPNTFGGGLTVAGGTVRTATAGALGFGGLAAITTTSTVVPFTGSSVTSVNSTATPASVGSSTVAAGGTLDLGGQTLTEPVTLNGGSLVNSSATRATLTSGVKGTPVTAGGIGYQSTDTVTTSGGTGALAVVSLGLTSSSITITNGGSYNSNPDLTSAPIAVVGGGGTGATFVPILDGGSSGSLTGIAIVNPGTGYTSIPTFPITTPTGNNSVGATFSGNTTGFTIIGTIQTAAGTGYVPGATSTVNTTTGSQATIGSPAVSSLALTATSSIGGTGDLTVQPGVSGSGGLVKIGADTVYLTATGTYSGGTTVSAGTLRANATAATGTAPVLIATGGTLGGNGSAGTVTVASGGTITAGPDAVTPGTLNTDVETWNASGGLLAKVSATGATNDVLVMAGLSLGASNTSGSQFNVTVTSAGTPTLASGSVLVLANDKEDVSSNRFGPAFNTSTLSDLTLTVTGLQSATGGFALGTEVDALGNGGYDLILQTAATPEPASLVLAGLAAAPLVLGRRRRRAS